LARLTAAPLRLTSLCTTTVAVCGTLEPLVVLPAVVVPAVVVPVVAVPVLVEPLAPPVQPLVLVDAPLV
jgi:hypothetical protein